MHKPPGDELQESEFADDESPDDEYRDIQGVQPILLDGPRLELGSICSAAVNLSELECILHSGFSDHRVSIPKNHSQPLSEYVASYE